LYIDLTVFKVVNLEFSSGQTCSFTMVAFTEQICERQTRIHFTHGELTGNMETFTTTDFKALTVHPSEQMNDGKAAKLHTPVIDRMSGHGGGDIGLIAAFVQAVKEGRQDILGITPDDVLASHLTVCNLSV
jgi:predicted dehydrogenase